MCQFDKNQHFTIQKWLELAKCGYYSRAGTIEHWTSQGAGTIRERVQFKSG